MNKILKTYLKRLQIQLEVNLDLLEIEDLEERHIKALLSLIYNLPFGNGDTMQTIREIRFSKTFRKLDLDPEF